MVREMTVGLQELAARGVCAERREDAAGEESPCAVAGVHDDMHSCERLLCPAERRADFIDEVFAVPADEVELQHVVERAVRLLRLRGIGEDLLDVLLVRAAGCGEEL